MNVLELNTDKKGTKLTKFIDWIPRSHFVGDSCPGQHYDLTYCPSCHSETRKQALGGPEQRRGECLDAWHEPPRD